MNKRKFEELKPKVIKSMTMFEDVNEEPTDKIISGTDMEFEELFKDNPPLQELRNYLTNLDYRCLSRKLSHLVKNFFEYHSCKSLFKNFAG